MARAIIGGISGLALALSALITLYGLAQHDHLSAWGVGTLVGACIRGILALAVLIYALRCSMRLARISH